MTVSRFVAKPSATLLYPTSTTTRYPSSGPSFPIVSWTLGGISP